jgi:hypothetical protein
VNTQPLLDQLAHIINDFTKQASKSAHSDLSDLPPHEVQALITRAAAAVQRIGGRHSSYASEVERVLTNNAAYLHRQLQPVIGVVKALFHDMQNGYLQSVIELVHAETFADFLEMAQHLLDTGYKDAAAVIAGSSLELHLRALCVKHGVDLEVTKQDGSKVPKKADAMNTDLAGKHAYTKNDQKSATAWLGLRNSAAHGKYTEYEKEQVTLLIEGIRQFIART